MGKKKSLVVNKLSILLLLMILVISTLSGCKKEPDSHQVDTSESQILVYVKAIDTENKTITVDEVEMLYPTDTERLAEIGIKSEDLITGYYIYNEEETAKSISYDDALSIELLDGVELVTASVEDFEKLLNEHEALCRIDLKGNIAVKISEQYLP